MNRSVALATFLALAAAAPAPANPFRSFWCRLFSCADATPSGRTIVLLEGADITTSSEERLLGDLEAALASHRPVGAAITTGLPRSFLARGVRYNRNGTFAAGGITFHTFVRNFTELEEPARVEAIVIEGASVGELREALPGSHGDPEFTPLAAGNPRAPAPTAFLGPARRQAAAPPARRGGPYGLGGAD